MAEFELSYTAAEIDEKLGAVDKKAEALEISLEDYNALSEEEQNNGTLYLIPNAVEVGTDMIIDETPTEGSANLVTSGGVYDEISKLNSELEDTGWLNTNLVRYRRKNGVVYVQYDYNSTTAITDGQQIGTLPEGFRPSFDLCISNYNANSYAWVKTDGAIVVNMVGTNNQVKVAHYYCEFPLG